MRASMVSIVSLAQCLQDWSQAQVCESANPQGLLGKPAAFNFVPLLRSDSGLAYGMPAFDLGRLPCVGTVLC